MCGEEMISWSGASATRPRWPGWPSRTSYPRLFWVGDRPIVPCGRIVPLELVLAASCSDQPPELSIAPKEDWLSESGFYIRDRHGISYFSYDGSLLRTVPNPPASVSYQGFPMRLYVLLEDGSFLGAPGIPASDATTMRYNHTPMRAGTGWTGRRAA